MILSLLLIIASLSPTSGLAATVSQPCTSGESWTFTQMPENTQDLFKQFLKGDLKPIEGFAEGLALRRLPDPELRALGEYWIARSLFEGKLYHIAFSGFASILAHPFSPAESTYTFAALACLNAIHARYPGLELPTRVTDQLQTYFTAAHNEEERSITRSAALYLLLSSFNNISSTLLDALKIVLNNSGSYDALAQLVLASKKGDHTTSIREGERFLSSTIPSPLQRYADTAHVLLARALFSTKQFDKSISHWRAVTKHSNELARSLSELSWAQLMAEHYKEAIGTAINLNQGGLRTTFAPEAPMVMAMAMNELCQYPQSVNAIRLFQKNYAPSYKWLSEWSKKSTDLYPHALAYLKGKSSVPGRISSEWIRSPLFLSHQDEINLLFDEKDSVSLIAKSAMTQETARGKKLLEFIAEFRPSYHIAKMKQVDGAPLPKEILNQLSTLRSMALQYQHLLAAAPIWDKVTSSHLASAPLHQARLVKSINKDLDDRTRRMQVQLDEITENMELVEVEIYNGASHDIIWQNAHPDYRKIASTLNSESTTAQGGLNWGQSHWDGDTADTDVGEIWEDELGSFQANLFDNCNSKDKYLALKKRGSP